VTVDASRLVKMLGGRFSSEMGINVASADPRELFKWLIAAILFGTRISEALATRTYLEFSKQNLLSPKSLLRRGWDGLVEVLDAGGYVHYDFKTATKLLEVSKALVDKYAGDLNQLHAAATDSRDLEQRLTGLAKGIGDVTVNIFLRELRGVWQKADPLPSDLALTAAADLLLFPTAKRDRRSLELLKKVWTAEGNRIADLPDFEAALIRHGLELRRRASRSVASRGSGNIRDRRHIR
jgi:endonuclease III